MKKILTLAALAVAALSSPAFALNGCSGACTTGYVKNLEVHVADDNIYFQVDSGGTQIFCGSVTKAYIPLTANTVGGYTWTQNKIDALKSAAFAARLSPIEVDVYTYTNGSYCAVVDIVLK